LNVNANYLKSILKNSLKKSQKELIMSESNHSERYNLRRNQNTTEVNDVNPTIVESGRGGRGGRGGRSNRGGRGGRGSRGGPVFGLNYHSLGQVSEPDSNSILSNSTANRILPLVHSNSTASSLITISSTANSTNKLNSNEELMKLIELGKKNEFPKVIFFILKYKNKLILIMKIILGNIYNRWEN